MNIKDLDTTPNRLVLGAIVISIIFIMIMHICKEQIQNILQTQLYTIKEVVIDLWSVTHFFIYAFFGFVKPGYPMSFFAMGSVFEIFEDGLASDETTQMVNCKKKSLLSNIMCNGVQDSYWYGKIDDIFVNLLGYVTGQAIRTTCYPNII
jgi:hypothetical protein